jgi:predicted metalloprotease with PDZ domain
VLPVRAGLIPAEHYREMLATLAGTYDVQSGARWRPLADTAVEAQVLYNAPAAWQSSRRDTDFYEASEFLWLNVDAELRSRSSGNASLDDFMKRFYAGTGGEPAVKPYVESDVYAALAAIAPGDWQQIVRHHLDSLGPEALLAGLEASGWRLEYTPEKNSDIELNWQRRKELDRRWSVGLIVDDKGQIVDTIEDRAAARAGAGAGMKLVAINGKAYAADDDDAAAGALDAAIAAAHEKHQPIELLIESAGYYRTLRVEYFDGARFPHLVRIAARPDTLSQALSARSN